MNEIEKQKWVYSQLEDEESRFIFEQRMQFNLDNDYNHVRQIITNYVPEFAEEQWYPGKEEELIHILQEKNKRVVIFGAGYFGKRVLDLCVRGGIEVVYFCDNDKEKHHTEIEKVPVISPAELAESIKNKDYLIVVSVKYEYDEIVETLLQLGISNSNIYVFSNYTDKSLKTQYFEDGIISFEENEVFVDGGCFDMRTSNAFLKEMDRRGLHCKRIYAFELDLKNAQKCKYNIDRLKLNNVKFIEAGLWNENKTLYFSVQGNGSSHISKQTENYKVQVVALDSCVFEKVTFIKMDIEGAELEALQGAEHIIKRDKPKLAICLYHKPEDIWEIPYYIKSLVPEYKLYVRHYSNCAGETVLYAVCG